jgi:hypothetical protein
MVPAKAIMAIIIEKTISIGNIAIVAMRKIIKNITK